MSERNFKKRGRPSHSLGYEARPMTDAELRAYRANQPRDERDLTGRLLGDPINPALAVGLAAGRIG